MAIVLTQDLEVLLNTYATFWSGPQISPFERACLASFACRGCSITVYSYKPVDGLPEGVIAGNAADIVPEETSQRFIHAGKPNLSHFSDYFRYKLFDLTPHIWVDADILLLRPIDFPVQGLLLAKERTNSINGAIMRLDRSPKLKVLLSRTEEAMDRELYWGETGPQLLSKVFGKSVLFDNAREARDFFPIGHDEFWRVFLPKEREWCEVACAESYSVHLWNNIVERLGIWKRLAPPVGSWLASRYEADGTIGMFESSYPAEVMERMIENWLFRNSGAALGIKTVLRQVVPSVGRTARFYRWMR